MSGVTTQNTEKADPGAHTGEASLRALHGTIYPQLLGFKQAVDDGELGEGSLWLVRIIEAGGTLNGEKVSAEVLQRDGHIFEGVSVNCFAFDADGNFDPTQDAGHLPEEVQDAAGGALVGNKVGLLEGIHWNEEAQALDGFFKVFDTTLRERMVSAHKMGDLGEGGERDLFGLSIDAKGDVQVDGEVLALRSAASVDLVTFPAAGGRVRRMVASVQKQLAAIKAQAKSTSSAGPDLPEIEEEPDDVEGALTHNSTVEDDEPAWGDVDKTELPDNAFATTDFAPDERRFPHHWVKDGRDTNDDGVFDEGDMFLHRGGLDAAWAAAMGARTGERADTRIIGHLAEHRRALGIDVDAEMRQAGIEIAEETPVPQSLKKAVTTRITQGLKDDALVNLMFDEVSRRISDLRWGPDAELPMAEKAALIKTLADDLASEVGVTTTERSMEEAVRLTEAAGELAGQLKLMADQLSAAPDEEVPGMLRAMQEAIEETLAQLQGEDPETLPLNEEESEEDAMPKQTVEAAKKKAGDGGAVKASLSKVLKAHGDKLPKKLREELCGIAGVDPSETPEQREIRQLREQLKEQAIRHAFDKVLASRKPEDGEVQGTELVFAQLNRDSITVADDGSTVSGLKEALDTFLKDNPFFIKAAAAPAADPAKPGEDPAAQVPKGNQGAGAGADPNAETTGEGGEGGTGDDGAAGGNVQQARVTESLTPLQQLDQAMRPQLDTSKLVRTGVSIRESHRDAGGTVEMTAKHRDRLRRLRRRILSGDTDAAVEHRRLQRRLGLTA